ncbi:spore coat protein [Rodentibacter rarus]|uniref:CgeB family protein n=1 Tax=Rodentibacter rarus TaxID=1908260 RepID=UPI00098496F4|nr:glycosyltransferase [Rodentibacter rarus]OOF42470.1 spore coat protein [Rodentibacter rarus]
MIFKIYLISDSLTSHSLNLENNTKIKESWFLLNKTNNPILLVESAWQGYRNRWKYKIASYPAHPKRNNQKLVHLVERAKEKGIPTVFWNKEDCIHFERFIDSAKYFEHVFTVDENCIPKYKAVMGENASIHTLMFAVQPKFHSFTGFNFKYNKANFVGSYSHHIHDIRREWQNSLFNTALNSGLGLDVFDRNSKRKSQNYRYPNLEGMNVYHALNYPDTAKIYKDYLVSLNVNTVVDSPTMFSRRLIEILACGGIAVTNPSLAVNALFKEYCHIVHNEEEMTELFNRLKFSPSAQDLERARAGAKYVAQYHTWAHRLEQIADVIGLR